MIKNRKKCEAFIIKYIDKIVPGGENKKLYVDMFKKMTDVEFHGFMTKLRSEKLILPVTVANDSKNKLDADRNFKIGEELGVQFFTQIYDTSMDGKIEFLSPQSNLVMDLPVRRARQTLLKGLSTASNSKKRNPITGQASGDSSAGKITMPEIQVMQGLGLSDVLMEFMGVRGGNTTAANARRAFIHKYGKYSQEDVSKFGGESGSTTTLRTIFKAAHIEMKGQQ